MFDKALITHLERLSLVRFSDEQAVFNLKQAVRFANQLKLIDTTVNLFKIRDHIQSKPLGLFFNVFAVLITLL